MSEIFVLISMDEHIEEIKGIAWNTSEEYIKGLKEKLEQEDKERYDKFWSGAEIERSMLMSISSEDLEEQNVEFKRKYDELSDEEKELVNIDYPEDRIFEIIRIPNTKLNEEY